MFFAGTEKYFRISFSWILTVMTSDTPRLSTLGNGPGTDRFTLPEPFVLPCIGHIWENEPVCRGVTCVYQQEELDKRVVAHDTPDDNGLLVQLSCQEVPAPRPENGKTGRQQQKL